MLIQKGLGPVDPLATLDDDYAHAVLHIAWDRNKETKTRALLFAMVELLPVEIPPPPDEKEQQARLGGSSNHYIYVRRVVAPARRALAWYLNCRRGVAALPNNEGGLPDAEDPAATRLVLAELGEEPPWPTLVSVSGESKTTPFCPVWHVNPRVHHLVRVEEMKLEKLWARETERTKAMACLSEWLHFSLEEYPEYWGSVHLVAPNPVYRYLDMRAMSGPQPRSSLVIRFQPRAQKSVEGLEFTCTKKNPWGALDLRRISIKSPLLLIDFDQAMTTFQVEVFDPDRGMLKAAYHAFGLNFKISTSTVTSRLSVKVDGASASYEVERRSRGRVFETGEKKKTVSAYARMLEAHSKRNRDAQTEAIGQRWFSGTEREASIIIREIINRAEQRALLVDPYFGPSELSFALAVGQEGFPIQILSSAEVLKQKNRGGLEVGDILLSETDRLGTDDRLNPMEIRVMTGDRPEIHDRFLLIDDRIWLLGSSLNEFGSRGTMMVLLPDPEPIRHHLFKAWNDAKDLRAWVETRRKNRKLTAPERI